MKNILIFSGFYDYEKLNNFIIDPNFYYYTNIYLPNVIYLKTDKKKPLLFLDSNSYKKIPNNSEYIKYKLIDFSLFRDEIKKYKYYSLNNLNEINKLIEIDNTILDEFTIDYHILEEYCINNRGIKDEYEIIHIKMACLETSKAIKDLWKNIKKYNNCFQLVNHIKCYLGKKNINDFSYNPICSSGYNNTILHNPNLDEKIKSNELILLDIGCKFNGYCSDITRTFPKNGKFNSSQKIIYNIVLKINKDSIKNLKENVNIDSIEKKCFENIYIELNKLNIFSKINKTINEQIELGKLFMYHKLSHSIGIDVHDPVNTNILKKNMIITIEPGIYFKKSLLKNKEINVKNIKKYMNVGGIRIEDTVLILKNKCKILNNITKEINSIEKLLY